MFYERLTSLCEKRGVKITHVAAELRMGSGNLSNWKSGRMPRGESLSKLADYFHVSTDYLLGRTDNPSPVGEEKGPAPVAEGGLRYPPEYDLLDPEDQALIDSMIRRLILEKNQGDASSPSNGAGSETA